MNNTLRFIDPDGMQPKSYTSISGYYSSNLGAGGEQDNEAEKEDPNQRAQREDDKDKGKKKDNVASGSLLMAGMQNAGVRGGVGIALDGAATGTALRGLGAGLGYGLVIGGIFYIGTGGFQELVPDIPIADVGAKTEQPKSITLFRGVNPAYMAQYILARQGIALPIGGDASPRDHSLGNTYSIYTSWSADVNVAAWRGGVAGVIMKIQMQIGDPRLFPNIFSKYPGEQEFLIIGPVTGAKVLKSWSTGTWNPTQIK